jgi:hypothetical protein
MTKQVTPWDRNVPASLAMPAGGSQGFTTGGWISSIEDEELKGFESTVIVYLKE